LRLGKIATGDDGDSGARLREQLGDREADPAGTAKDDGCLLG
jgi:hypothetical protein